jgi:hypothetical protein
MKFALVIVSLNSKSCALAALSIVASSVKNKRRTLILSNAEVYERAVLSPKRIIPAPGEKIIGLILYG